MTQNLNIVKEINQKINQSHDEFTPEEDPATRSDGGGN